MTQFAAYIPIGPSPIELTRAVDLIESLCTYEPSVRWIVIVDDTHDNRCLTQNFQVPTACAIIILPHPRQSHYFDSRGAVCTADLVALSYIHENLDPDFVMKLDTDALVVAPFSHKTGAKFRQHQNAGILGVLGQSCNREVRSFVNDAKVMRRIDGAMQIAQQLRNNTSDGITQLEALNIRTEKQIRNFAAICDQISIVANTGFKGEHCQGGAYAVSREMINRMFVHGFLKDPTLWTGIPFNEDRMMGIYCAAVGLNCVDYSERNEPFGIQARGLAYPPEILLQSGYSLIHSVKDSSFHTEIEIRQIFRSVRIPVNMNTISGHRL